MFWALKNECTRKLIYMKDNMNNLTPEKKGNVSTLLHGTNSMNHALK